MATNITFHPGRSSFSLEQPCHPNIFSGSVTTEERSELLGQKGVTIWFTGLSASGKVSLLVVRS